ncbi:MAG: hypothetical protein ABIJ47_15800 [Candidatus Bathyarchaeota archaeon]
MVELEAMSIVFTGLSISLAAFYYTMTLRNAQRTQQQQLETRQAQLFMQVYSKWQDKDFNESKQLVLYEYKCDGFDDYDAIMRDKEKAANLRVIGTFLEGLGVLVKRRLVDVGFVDDMMSGDVLRFWDKYGGAVREFRVRRDYPQALEYTELLYTEIKAVAERQLVAKRA